MKNILAIVVCALFLSSCTKKDLKPTLSALEQSVNAEYNPAKADSLITLSQEYAKQHPEDQANNLHYLTRAAELLFINQQKGAPGVKLVNEAVAKYGKNQPMSEAAGLMARMWAAYNYKAAQVSTLDPDDIDKLNVNLEANLPWIDSSLIELERKMATGNSAPDPAVANKFIQISEGYAFLVQASSPLKCSELLMKAAGLAKTINDPNKALQLYYTVVEKLPPHPRQPTALFMMGFIYANDLNNPEKAKQTYQDFLSRYPKDELAESAKVELSNVGKTPEQILNEINRKNNGK